MVVGGQSFLITGNWTLATAVGAVAQLGERLVCNQEATGSIPVSSTRIQCLGVAYMEQAILLIVCIGLGLWVSYRRFEHVLPFKVVRRGK